MATRKILAGKPQKRSWRSSRAAASGVLTLLVSIIVAIAYFINGAPPEDSVTATDVTVQSSVSSSSLNTGSSGTAIDPVRDFREMLAGLDIKGRAPMTGYERELFGTAWTDDVDVEFGRNGCDTRNDILRRDLTDLQIREGTRGCMVEKGTLQDPFSGDTINFVRGQSTSGEVQIDHVVPLADAWQKGAQQWDEQTRKNFANDPDNLLAVQGRLNSQKGASDAATWLPPNRAFRCDYAKIIITVKDRYDVWVTQAESDALSVQLDTCSV